MEQPLVFLEVVASLLLAVLEQLGQLLLLPLPLPPIRRHPYSNRCLLRSHNSLEIAQGPDFLMNYFFKDSII